MNADPQMVLLVQDRRAGLDGFLVIDSLVSGRSCGGLRIEADLTLSEVKDLARAMTLKYGFLDDMALGGAKAGIAAPPDCPAAKRARLLRAFGRQIAPILKSGIYIPWTDMNTSSADINKVLQAAGLEPRNMPDSAYYTALSVFASVRAACEFRGIRASAATVAIEGFGSVGTYLARELENSGFRLVAVSNRQGAIFDPAGLDTRKMISLRQDTGDTFIRRYRPETAIRQKDLLELEVDVLVPCARPWTIDDHNAGKVRAKTIVQAANCPVSAGAEELLHQNQVLSIPYYVCNIGGIFGSRLEYKLSGRKIRDLFLEDFRRMVKNLLQRSAESRCSPGHLARSIAEKQIRAKNARPTGKLLEKAKAAGFFLFEHGLIPKRAVESVFYARAKRNLESKLTRVKKTATRDNPHRDNQ